jgi:Domain of unknown function (DUF4387)
MSVARLRFIHNDRPLKIERSLKRDRDKRRLRRCEAADLGRVRLAKLRRFTLDIVFRNDADYQRAAQSEALTADKIAPLYGVTPEAVQIVNYPLGRAIKIVVPRAIMSGDPGDRDVYGAQQHTPLLKLEI